MIKFRAILLSILLFTACFGGGALQSTTELPDMSCDQSISVVDMGCGDLLVNATCPHRDPHTCDCCTVTWDPIIETGLPWCTP